MQLSLRQFSNLFRYSEVVIYGALFFLVFALYAMPFFNSTIENAGIVEHIEGCESGLYFENCDRFILNEGVDPLSVISDLNYSFSTIQSAGIVATAILIAMVLWLVLRGRRIKKELRRVRSDYTNQAYYFTLSTSTFGDEEDISMDFFEIAQEIFPELKEEDIRSVKKTGKELEVEDLIIEDEEKKKKKEFHFNVVAKTKEGYFLITDFANKEVSYADLEEMVKIAKENFGGWIRSKGIFRIVCLAKNYDDKAIRGYDKLQEKDDEKVPIDLIAVGEKGFSFVKIGIED